MCRIRRVPPSLDKFFRPLSGHFHWDHCTYFRLLTVAIAFLWGRRNVANLYRYRDAEHHRTRCNHCFLVERWDPAAALRQQAHARLQALQLQPGDSVYLIRDDAKKAQRGMAMDAIATMKDPVLEAYIWGHQYVCAILVYRDHVIPLGIRLSVKQERGAGVGVPLRKTTELAADLIREVKTPAGVKVMVLFDASYLCHTVVQAGREQGFHVASTLKSHRSLFKPGWKRKAGRYGKHLCRRRRTEPLMLEKPHEPARYRDADADAAVLCHTARPCSWPARRSTPMRSPSAPFARS